MDSIEQGVADNPRLSGFTFGGRLGGWWIDPIVQCLVFIVVVSAVFIALPGIDVWFTGLFTAPKTAGFPVASLPAFEFLRDANRLLTWIVPIALVVVMIVKLIRPERPSLVAPAQSLFLLVTLAVGPGLVTNLLFKDHWGRPRPENVDIFGGHLPFVPAWQVTNYCTANCSFISGEASSAIWLLGLAILVPKAWRPAAVKWIAGFVALVSLDRIAFGGHFLSDVLLGWGFTLLVMAIAYRLMLERPIAWLANDRQEARWTRLGVAIRQRLGFPTPALDGTAFLDEPTRDAVAATAVETETAETGIATPADMPAGGETSAAPLADQGPDKMEESAPVDPVVATGSEDPAGPVAPTAVMLPADRAATAGEMPAAPGATALPTPVEGETPSQR